MLCVNEAQYLGEYKIHLRFNNGKQGTANLKKTIFEDKRPVFSKLKQEAHFKQFQMAQNTLVWSEEFDLAAEYLFYLAFKENPEFQNQFKQWGYTI